MRPIGVHPLRRAFLLGLVTAAVYFTGTVYWVTRVMVMYGNLQTWVAVLVNAGMVATQAIHPALFAVLLRRIVLAHGRAAVMSAPLVWVVTELTRTHMVYLGFPWVLLGNSQASVLPIAQLASVFGVYGVSMLIAAVSAGLALVVVGSKPARFVPIGLVLALVGGVAIWGSQRVAWSEWTREGDPVRVGLVQGNVDQAIKWDAARSATIFEEHLRLTQQAIDRQATFVLWPESSTPFMFDESPLEAERIRALVRRTHVTMLFGSDQVEWRTVDNRRVPGRIFNSAFLVAPDGTTGAVYRKMHLVPFGEYVPMKELLFFAAPLVEAVSDFSPGDSPVLLPVAGHKASTAICYEIIYPALVRRFVVDGSELLTTITNDAWFGDTSAPYQHFAQASMRAIEDGRYLVRSANTGISGIVDPYGRILEQTSVYTQAVVVGEARFLRTSTFYARHGDVLAYAAAVFTVVALFAPRRRVQ